ncbi:MAG: helical backbone metal receptor [Chitinophagales bacterium]
MGTRVFTDMMGNKAEVNYPPKRIISIVPSQTELLYDLGLDEEIVGITKFCVHPDEWYRNKKRVGGTKAVHIDLVKALQPDLIIANKEENTKEQVEELASLYPTWVSDIHTIDDALHMIRDVGSMTGRAERAALLSAEITEGFSELKNINKPKRVAYFIWRKPWMCAGGDTFISNMIEQMGWLNVLADKQRYPEITLDILTEKRTDLVLLSSEPYPFKKAHIAEIKTVLTNAEVIQVDGEMFSWYGSRMKKAIKYFASLIEKPN